jgi:hypothetical protein
VGERRIAHRVDLATEQRCVHRDRAAVATVAADEAVDDLDDAVARVGDAKVVRDDEEGRVRPSLCARRGRPASSRWVVSTPSAVEGDGPSRLRRSAPPCS